MRIISIDRLAQISILLILASILLSVIGFQGVFGASATSIAPFSIVLSQNIWNAAKVFFYILLVVKLVTDKNMSINVTFLITILLLPFSQYLLSPGGLLLSLLMLVVFSIELLNESKILTVGMQEGKKNRRFSFQKFEVLGFFCLFFCSLYNAKSSELIWPYWNSWFSWLNNVFQWPKEASSFVNFFYSMGLHIPVPSSLPHANDNGFSLLIFSLIWSVLPFLYVLYFFALYIESKNAPCIRLQKLLCLFCIFHFLFLTNAVGYRFSRGWDNSYAEWFHWSERIAWRVAILLPIYQSVLSGFWKKNSRPTVLHYFMMIWGGAFFIYQVLIFDVLRFISFVNGVNLSILEKIHLYYYKEIGYLGALVFISLYYLFRLILNSKSHLWIIWRGTSQTSESLG